MYAIVEENARRISQLFDAREIGGIYIHSLWFIVDARGNEEVTLTVIR